MAVDIIKYPTQSGTGQSGNPRLSFDYNYLCNTALTQVEGAYLDDDSICYSTSSSRLNVSAMCHRTYYQFDFHFGDNDMVEADLSRTEISKFPKAGMILTKHNSSLANEPYFRDYGSGQLDFKPLALYEFENRYGLMGNSDTITNNVQFITGFDWWSNGCVIMLVLMEFNAEDGYIELTNQGIPNILRYVTYDTYKTTYENNPEFICIGAYLKSNMSNNFSPAIHPWCGYNSPSYSYTGFAPTPYNYKSHRVFELAGSPIHTSLTFGDGVSIEGNYPRSLSGGGYITIPLVDTFMMSFGMGVLNNASKSYSRAFKNTVCAIRGGSEVYTMSEMQFYSPTYQKIFNGYVTLVNVDKLIKSACSYGLLIQTKDGAFWRSNWSNYNALKTWAQNNQNVVYVPIPDDNGCYSGEYMELYDFLINGSKDISPYFPENQEDWTAQKVNPDLAYDNSQGGGGQDSEDSDIDDTELNDVKLNAIGVFNRCFAVSLNELRELSDYIYNADEATATAIERGVSFMGDNPSNALISLVQTPFDVPSMVTGGGTLGYVKLGRFTTPVQGLILPPTMSSIFDFGELEVPYPSTANPLANTPCFLDFEPHTTLELYIPYIGIIPLSAKEVMGKKVNVRLIVDWQTNTTCGVIFVNGIMLTYRTGTINTSIEMTASTRAVNVTGYMKSVVDVTQSGAQIGLGISSGNLSQTVFGTTSLMKSMVNMYDSMAQPTQFKSIGATTSSNAQYLPPYPYLIMSTVKDLTSENYGRSIGFACDEYVALNYHGGFTICGGDIPQVARTERENDMLAELLHNGVII